MKTKISRNKRVLVILLGLIMTAAQIGLIPSNWSYAVSDDTTVLAFTSDVHNDQSNYTGESRLGTWIDNVIS